MANMTFKANLLPETNLGYSLGSSDKKWKINGLNGQVIPFIIGTGATAGTWLGELTGLTAYYDGLIILYKIPIAGADTTTLNLNNLGAKTVYLNNTTKLTTHFPINQPILLIYSANTNNGCWTASDYNSNTTYSVMSAAEMTTGTATSNRVMRAANIKSALTQIITTGTTNGTIKVYNTEVPVAGLGDRAFDSTTYLPLSGGTMTGTLTVKGLKGTSNIDYGQTLPQTGTEGQIFLQVSDPEYELPDGGTTGQTLIKNSNTNKDVTWGNPSGGTTGEFLRGDGVWSNELINTSTFNEVFSLRSSNTFGCSIAYILNGYSTWSSGAARDNQYYIYNSALDQWPFWIGADGATSFRSTQGNLMVYANNITKGSTSNADRWYGLYWADSTLNSQHEGGRLGIIEGYRNAANTRHTICLRAYEPVAGSGNSVEIHVGYDSGNRFGQCNAPFYGAVWNDYAEYRQSNELEPGRCIVENGNGILSRSTERLQKGCEIVSDTFGFAIGQSDTCKTPTAATGRVLAYLLESKEEARKNIGQPVCSGPNGTVSIMTDEECRLWPQCIIGTISEIPNYKIWHAGTQKGLKQEEIKVNGRIWIRIR